MKCTAASSVLGTSSQAPSSASRMMTPAGGRELGFLGSLPGLLRLQQPGGNVARQKACNLLCALETVQLLVEAQAGKPAAGAAPVAKVLSSEEVCMPYKNLGKHAVLSPRSSVGAHIGWCSKDCSRRNGKSRCQQSVMTGI